MPQGVGDCTTLERGSVKDGKFLLYTAKTKTPFKKLQRKTRSEATKERPALDRPLPSRLEAA